MLLTERHTDFPWGVLLITDASSTEPIPSWARPEEQVTSARTALVVRVLHADEGQVAVHVWDDQREARGGLVFEGEIDTPSGTLRVSDALGKASAELALAPGRHPIQIFTNAATEASSVHLDLVETRPDSRPFSRPHWDEEVDDHIQLDSSWTWAGAEV
jgi:hypothetical protein